MLLLIVLLCLGLPILVGSMPLTVGVHPLLHVRKSVTPPPLCDIDPTKTTYKIRVVNLFMLPFSNIGKKVKKAVQAGVLSNVDFVLAQELFRQPWFARDTAQAFVDEAKCRVAVSVPEVKNRPMAITDSGLGALAVGPCNTVCFVAFEPFESRGKFPDSLSDKGVAIFRLNDKVNVAVTHLQASYKQSSLHGDDHFRLAQFRQAVKLAMRHGAVVLVGDFNSHTPENVTAMKRVLAEATRGAGYLLPNDGQSTSKRAGKQPSDTAWRLYDDGVIIDHCWVLVPGSVGVARSTTNKAVTEGWSDHAAIEFTLTFPSAKK